MPHIDCNGFGTFITVDSGLKLWFVAVPKKEQGQESIANRYLFDDFAKISLYTENFDLNTVDSHLWDWVPVVLRPGMKL